jgi:hypothetical protein
MIHNLYTNTINNVRATEDFKLNLTGKCQPQTITSFSSIDKKNKFTKIRKLTFASAFVIVIIVAGIFGGILVKQKNISAKVLPPHFKVNNQIYWTNSYKISVLPSNYQLIGKILSYGSDDKLENFQSTFGSIGCQIYIDPTNSNAAYLRTGNKSYELYVTQNLRKEYVYYNDILYVNSSGIGAETNKIPSDFKFSGIIKYVDYTRLPSRNFETNLLKSLGYKIYASETEKGTIYVQSNKGDYYDGDFIHLKKQ